MNEERPKLHINWQPIDWLFEVMGAIALVLMVILPILYFNVLPDEVPRHFNTAGQPDAMGSKTTILLLAGIGVVMYLGLWKLNQYPHTFNYPVRITKENAYYQYEVATRMMRLMNVLIATSFAYIIHRIIQNALGNTHGLGPYFLPVFLGTMGLVIFYGIYQSTRKN